MLDRIGLRNEILKHDTNLFILMLATKVSFGFDILDIRLIIYLIRSYVYLVRLFIYLLIIYHTSIESLNLNYI